jgi:hypothetical protein
MKNKNKPIGGGITGGLGCLISPPFPLSPPFEFQKPQCCSNIDDHLYKIKQMGNHKHIECIKCQVEWFE